MSARKYGYDKYLKVVGAILLFVLFGAIQAGEVTDAVCGVFDQKPGLKIELEITQHEEAYKTNELNFGFNAGLGQTAGANGDYYSNNFVRLVSTQMPNTLRYPGGTVANYFNWTSEQLSEQHVVLYANKHINSLLKRLKKENNGMVPTANLASFSNLVTHQNIKPFIVLNVFESNDNIIKAISKVKREIKIPVYWELGNEIAYRSYQKNIKLQNGMVWGEEAYLKKVIEISKYIKNKYPLDKIGVVASEMAEWRNPKSKSTWIVESRRESWDKIISSASHYYDAVIVHPYIFAGDNFISDIDVQCLNNTRLGRGEKYKLWIMSNVSNLPSLYLKRLNKRYPGKKIWITEFGVMDPGGKNINLKLQKHTGFRVLSSAANYISWLSEYPKVTTLLTHGLFVGYDWTHTLFPDYSFTANGIAFKFIREYLSNIDEISPVSLNGYQATRGVDSFADMSMQTIYSIAGHDKKSGVQSFLIVNVANYELNLKLPWRANSVVTKSFEWSERIKPGDYTDLTVFNKYKVDQSDIMLPPRSINLVKSDAH
ncbi:MAG: hypothetical protein L3J26_11840 [Candidatus Polarisedimenticolaceae bacterium]|nr:hypothetical protein [Candidatus Polarisedimenticolaceae bacterium]